MSQTKSVRGDASVYSCAAAVGCCVGGVTRGRVSRLILCTLNQPAISGRCGSSGRQGQQMKVALTTAEGGKMFKNGFKNASRALFELPILICMKRHFKRRT